MCSMGQGVHEGRPIVLKLEQEAAAFTKGKQTQFNDALDDFTDSVMQFMSDNLYNTTETAEAKKRFTEAIMWAKFSSRLHGIK